MLSNFLAHRFHQLEHLKLSTMGWLRVSKKGVPPAWWVQGSREVWRISGQACRSEPV